MASFVASDSHISEHSPEETIARQPVFGSQWPVLPACPPPVQGLSLEWLQSWCCSMSSRNPPGR